MPTTNPKIVTGVDYAVVRVRKPDGSVLREDIVRRGQPLAPDVPAAEVERLAKFGVFDNPAPALTTAEAARAATARVTPDGRTTAVDGRTVPLPGGVPGPAVEAEQTAKVRQLEEELAEARAAQGKAEQEAALAKQEATAAKKAAEPAKK
jgi:hypothetical protein